MRRRALLATAGTVALAGCTASGDEGGDEIDITDYTVAGVGNSEVYHGFELFEAQMLWSIILQTYQGLQLGIRFDTDADYDPLKYEVLLLDGHDQIAEGESDDRFMEEEYPDLVTFELSPDMVKDGGPYRVVSKDDAGTVDEFELEIVQAGDSDGK
ncbi:hypothetical protein [Natrinema sp. DC36]|uniref:hypothetical protein n=1 Tax=Natrinema sp. DC36 TaxID=2878680 RepID=UPI001CF0CADD|nr:hypothetical protein [Natrinema sp. DC36]